MMSYPRHARHLQPLTSSIGSASLSSTASLVRTPRYKATPTERTPRPSFTLVSVETENAYAWRRPHVFLRKLTGERGLSMHSSIDTSALITSNKSKSAVIS
jgi:hypothetical protein